MHLIFNERLLFIVKQTWKALLIFFCARQLGNDAELKTCFKLISNVSNKPANKISFPVFLRQGNVSVTKVCDGYIESCEADIETQKYSKVT